MTFQTRRVVQCFAAFGFALFAFPETGPGQAAERPPMRSASELIRKTPNAEVYPRVFEKLKPDNTRVRISLSEQLAWLMAGEEIAVATPISSGKRRSVTPAGTFTVLEKIPDHRSTIYGDFVDEQGRVVRSGVSLKIDAAPSGTHFAGAPMRHFLRFNAANGLHAGVLPGYPASHGCVRLPNEIAELFFRKVATGTPVEILE